MWIGARRSTRQQEGALRRREQVIGSLAEKPLIILQRQGLVGEFAVCVQEEDVLGNRAFLEVGQCLEWPFDGAVATGRCRAVGVSNEDQRTRLRVEGGFAGHIGLVVDDDVRIANDTVTHAIDDASPNTASRVAAGTKVQRHAAVDRGIEYGIVLHRQVQRNGVAEVGLNAAANAVNRFQASIGVVVITNEGSCVPSAKGRNRSADFRVKSSQGHFG